MDTAFMIYQQRTELWKLLYAHWKAETMTITYLGIIVFIVLAYATWWRFTDKRQLTNLLLFGALISLGASIVDSFGVESGLWLYRTHILPMDKSYLLHIMTITPLTLMLVQQYSANWKQFFVWNAVGCSFIAFVIKPLLAALGIYQLMYWNYLYTFVLLYIGSTFVRGVLHFILAVQAQACEKYDSSLQSLLPHPAFKPLDKDKDNKR